MSRLKTTLVCPPLFYAGMTELPPVLRMEANNPRMDTEHLDVQAY